MNMNSIGLGVDLSDPLGKDQAANATASAGRTQAQAITLGIDEQRRQFDAVQALLAPFVGAGRDALGELSSGSTLTGFADRLKAIMGSDAFQPLVDERMRAAQNHLAGAGLTRSGFGAKTAAAVPTDLALAIEEALFGRTSNLANMGQASAVGQANVGTNISSRIAEMMGQRGEAIAGGIIGGQQARAAMTGQVLNAGASVAAAAIMFSDPRLKTGMERIGQIGPLGLYEWDWLPEVRDMVGTEMSLGFNADEVEEHYPEFITKVAGFKAIAYPALTARLRADYGIKEA